MANDPLPAERFVAHRPHLLAVAYRLLGSRSDAEDAVQEAWLRSSRADTSAVQNLGGWLTTVVSRVGLDMLRSRASRREEALDGGVAGGGVGGGDPEQETVLAESVGLAMLVVLERLSPAERVAFVLHDMFDLTFDEIAPIVGRSAVATRQLASRARRRVRGGTAAPDAVRQRAVVDAFLAASRGGDLAALLAVLDPEVVLRVDGAAVPDGVSREVHGAETVASQALLFSVRTAFTRPALVDGAVGLVVAPAGKLAAVLALRVAGGRIVAIDVIGDPERLRRLELNVLGG